MHSFNYKGMTIHVNFTGCNECISVTDKDINRYYVKSVHAAKLKITKLLKDREKQNGKD